jgi:2-polyprenyl-3-methyl-5-hydroxy-6-metoxy-1,4-benzoquinol methylase
MKAFWNQRYAENDYAYGTTPNLFLKSQLALIPKGKILFVAEGEGRNAVYVAQQGFEVVAFDSSEEGKNKAQRLAKQHQVGIDYQVADIEDIQFEANSFDAVVFIFAHFPAEVREAYYQKTLCFLKPGGHIVFEGFGKAQIHLNSGGPKQVDMLFSETEIKTIFSNVDFKFIETTDIHLDEGPFHQGKANVVRFLGMQQL